MIPKKIHQIWLGPKQTPSQWMKSWPDHNPGYGFHLWRHPHQRLINQKQFDYYYQREMYHGAADVYRYEILLKYGGFVAPADSECLQSIDPLMTSEHKCFACYESEVMRPGLISPHLACNPGEPLMIELIKEIGKLDPPGEPYKETGNYLLTKLILTGKFKIKIYPSHYFIPYHYTGHFTKKHPIFAIHHWGTTKNKYRDRK